MKKWVISAIAYLAIVIVGYNVYAFTLGTDEGNHSSDSGVGEHQTENDSYDEKGHGSDDEHGSDDGHGSDDAHGSDGGHGSHGDHGSEPTSSEVAVTINATEENLTIYLNDLAGNPVENLEVNHEKLLHLIIVDEHLEQYLHLHPEQIDKGVFETSISLTSGSYKAFVDIKPKELEYVISPVEIQIGEPTGSHGHASLEVDEMLTKTINNQEATLTTTLLEAGKPVTLTFKLPDASVEPYLGAMGHVVILDETAEKFIHVHPINDSETIFETQFNQPGIYKLWGEFKIDGDVFVYPFVVEVK